MRALTGFVRDAVESAASSGVVVGLSGGIDSALAAALAVRALGPERVARASSSPTAPRARVRRRRPARSRRSSDSPLRTIDITPQIDAYFDAHEPDADPVRRGNKMARERMTILFDQAKKMRPPGPRHLEQDRDPARLLDRLRRQRQLAQPPRRPLQAAGLAALPAPRACPRRWSSKPPSADLWPGQSDEGELGFDYGPPTRCSTCSSTRG